MCVRAYAVTHRCTCIYARRRAAETSARGSGAHEFGSGGATIFSLTVCTPSCGEARSRVRHIRVCRLGQGGVGDERRALWSLSLETCADDALSPDLWKDTHSLRVLRVHIWGKEVHSLLVPPTDLPAWHPPLT